MKSFKFIVSLLGLVVLICASFFIENWLAGAGVVYSIFLFQAAGGVGVTTSYTMTYVPQYLIFNDGGNIPTGIKVTVLGDGIIHDTAAAQLPLIRAIRLYGNIANQYMIPLANGIIKGKNTTIDFTTSAVGAIDVYGVSFEEGDAYVTTLQQTVLANSGAEFRKWAYLCIPAMGATDYVNIEFEDGTVQRFEQEEIPTIAGNYQNLVAAQYIIDNIDARIRMLQLIPAANRTLGVMRYVQAV